MLGKILKKQIPDFLTEVYFRFYFFFFPMFLIVHIDNNNKKVSVILVIVKRKKTKLVRKSSIEIKVEIVANLSRVN